jgi:hypothetical protein
MKDDTSHSSAAGYIRGCVDFYIRLAGRLIFYVSRSWKVPLVVLFLCLVFAGYKYSKLATVYTGQQTLVYNTLHKKVYGEWIQAIDDLIQRKEYAVLVQKLQLSEADIRMLRSIKATNIAGSPLHEDITEAKLPFYITYVYSGNGKGQQDAVFQRGILNYLNRHPSAVNSVEKLRSKRQLRMSYLERQLGLLDSIRRQSLGAQAAVPDMKELYALSDQYFEELSTLQQQEKVTTAVELFDVREPVATSPASWLWKRAVPVCLSILLISILVNAFIYWYRRPRV